mmetsp:Transcript_174498/g.559394  ORF Transcript_174498/g.559394 Transcript_174498/m.559394 type:complete len:332 (+) Transcript_174498:169-1164(+)
MTVMSSSRSGTGLKGSAATVGMMEGAFFVGRSELLNWVNGLLQTSITKVEQCASGAVYCQILDACHPASVSMKKVNWMAKADHEFIPNYKALQAAFDKNSIQRHIAVDQLIRAKYQDNLEFLQFMKCYWDHEGDRDYDPGPAREGKTLPPWAKGSGDGALRAPGEKENVRPRSSSGVVTKVAAAADAGRRPATVARAAPGAAAAAPAASAAAAGRAAAVRPASRAGYTGGAPSSPTAEVGALQAKTVAQAEEIEDLRSAMEGIEHERDYYFRKLREVEILCSSLQAQVEEGADVTPLQVITDVQGILYAENEEEAEPKEEPAEEAEDAPAA